VYIKGHPKISVRVEVIVYLGHVVRIKGHAGEGGEVGWVVTLPL
jgi:hypothetical protein